MCLSADAAMVLTSAASSLSVFSCCDSGWRGGFGDSPGGSVTVASFGEKMRGMRYTSEQRAQISEQVAGRKVEALEYEPEGDYWAMTFDDGTEISFRFMAELA